MKFYKITKVFDWGKAPEEYCATELPIEDVRKRIDEESAGKKGYENCILEEVERPPHMWLKRHIENMEKIIEYYRTLL